MATYPPNTIPENGDDQQLTLKKILAALTGGAGGSGTPGIPVVPSNWVRHSANLGASASQAIPAGAYYQYAVITGTAGDGTMTGLPAGYTESSPTPISVGFSLTTQSASSAKVVWFTAS